MTAAGLKADAYLDAMSSGENCSTAEADAPNLGDESLYSLDVIAINGLPTRRSE